MNIPEGWPTREMIEAGNAVYPNRNVVAIFNAMFQAAPTPPAQEVEPFGYHVSGWRGKRTQVLIPCQRLEEAQSRASKLKDAVITPIYTHPANDGLRKAAEEFVEKYQGELIMEGSEEFENLRAELNKDKS